MSSRRDGWLFISWESLSLFFSSSSSFLTPSVSMQCFWSRLSRDYSKVEVLAVSPGVQPLFPLPPFLLLTGFFGLFLFFFPGWIWLPPPKARQDFEPSARGAVLRGTFRTLPTNFVLRGLVSSSSFPWCAGEPPSFWRKGSFFERGEGFVLSLAAWMFSSLGALFFSWIFDFGCPFSCQRYRCLQGVMCLFFLIVSPGPFSPFFFRSSSRGFFSPRDPLFPFLFAFFLEYRSLLLMLQGFRVIWVVAEVEEALNFNGPVSGWMAFASLSPCTPLSLFF